MTTPVRTIMQSLSNDDLFEIINNFDALESQGGIHTCKLTEVAEKLSMYIDLTLTDMMLYAEQELDMRLYYSQRITNKELL